jgi:hypothetical protein
VPPVAETVRLPPALQVASTIVGDPKTITAITDQGFVYYIGRGLQAATEFWNGDIAELMIYNVALDTTNQTSIQDYLNTKWGVY